MELGTVGTFQNLMCNGLNHYMLYPIPIYLMHSNFGTWNLLGFAANLSNGSYICMYHTIYACIEILELGTAWNANLSNGLFIWCILQYIDALKFWNLELLERKFK